MVSPEVIAAMAGRIAEQFRPLRIILFGSYARGDASEDSDVDLLVVLPAVGPRGQRSAPMIRMLAEEFPLPVDVIVQSAETMERNRQVPGTLAHRVWAEGVTLYEG